ncbi:unnamed protein product [Pieris brassicae]|uniref:Uncharacterized protein n=1 Tax=Pieris brassicae TaxID=7116 RepID=A0A9P0TBS0_PIEBR|nr:unnamed protein product [Pieris brassicae]
MKGKSKNGYGIRRSLFSSEDPEKMADELDKIKRHTIKQPENTREFCSYFYGRKKSTDPFYLVTSHATSSPKSAKTQRNYGLKEQVFTTYPTFVPGLHWSPSVDSFTDDGQDEQDFVCRRCRNCKETFVPERRVFKDNIIRFCDNSTMTFNVNDAACEVPRPRAAYSSTISITASDIAVRDEPEPQVRFTPTPILKKFDDDSFSLRYCERSPVEVSEIEDDDIDYMYIEPCPKPRRARLPTCPKLNEISPECSEPRKNIYNEGISDAIANNFPNFCPLANRMQVPAKRNYSRTSVFSKNIEIPFAHQGGSKYHHECKTEGKRQCYSIQEEVRLASKPRALKPSHPGGLERCDLAPCGRMPRRVLSSERDIDSYIQKQNRKPNFF